MDPFTQADVVNIIFIILPTHTRDEVDYLDKLADELAQDKPMEKILESRISYVLGEDWEIISLLN